ncbi:MAG: DUF6458 family protein [Thermoleophilaceae bacterium]
MGIGTSLFLIAAGAILKYAVTASVSGIELATVGTILMVIGILGLVIALLYPVIANRGSGEAVQRERVSHPDEAPTRRYR